VASLAERVALDGYTNINGWMIRPGFKWRLLRVRSSGSGEPIYVPDLQNGRGGSLYGYPLEEVSNGAWDPTVADLLLGDWSMAIIGTRQDITFKMFDQGVIVDDTGKVIYNAAQQDGQIMRVVMRLAFATANPVTALNATSSTRYPFGVLATGSSSAS
jgi:HK97 family phage major capsid protein